MLHGNSRAVLGAVPHGATAPVATPVAGEAHLPVLAARLRPPPLPAGYVERLRLFEILDRAPTGSLTAVTGPAGSGKTVLASAWVQARADRLPTVWLGVDPGTGQGGVASLWAHLLAALRADPGPLGAATSGVAPPARGEPAERFWRELANALTDVAEPAAVVVDDVDLLTDQADLAGLELLLGHATAALHLVVCYRVPVLAAHRLRLAGRLAEVGPADLAFTAAEAEALLGAHGMADAGAVAARLAAETQGWAAGLRLRAAAIPRGSPGAPTGPVSSELPGAVCDYLDAEVLDPLPAPVQAFLVRTSVLDRVSGALADAVDADAVDADALGADAVGAGLLPARPRHPTAAGTGAARPPGGVERSRAPGAALLAELTRSNVFVVAADGHGGGDGAEAGCWYRYHRVFAQVLRSRLRRDGSQDEPELHLRAALWFAANRRTVDAVRHAQRAGDWPYAACLLVYGTFPALVDGVRWRFRGLVDDMPVHLAAVSPECAALVGLRQVLVGDAPAAAASLDLARSGLAGLPPWRRRASRNAVDLVELLRAQAGGDPVAVLDAARHLMKTSATTHPGAAAPPAGPPPASSQQMRASQQMRVLALAARGSAQLWCGQVEAASETLRSAARQARAEGMPGAELASTGTLALLEAWRGRLRQAEAYAHAVHVVVEVVAGWSQAGVADRADGAGSAELPGIPAAHLALAVVAYQRGDLAGAGERLRAASAGRPGAEPHLADLLDVVGARVRACAGGVEQVRAARRMLATRRHRRGGHGGADLYTAARTAADADLLVAAGCPRAALDLLRGGPGGGGDPAVPLAAARALLACGDAEAAAVELTPLLRADAGVGTAGVVGACVLDAVCAGRVGDDGRVGASLARAVALAADEGLVRPFLDGGAEVVASIGAHPSLRESCPDFVQMILDPASEGRWRRGHGPDSPAVGSGITVPKAARPLRPAPPEAYAPGSVGGRKRHERNLPVPLVPPRPPRAAHAAGSGMPTRAVVAQPASALPAGGPYPPAAAPAFPGRPDAGVGVDVGAQRPAGPEHLSDRERAVLSYLPTMLTTAEIAAEMYLSVNTVKTHLKSIYRKLNVARRREAVQRARELCLL